MFHSGKIWVTWYSIGVLNRVYHIMLIGPFVALQADRITQWSSKKIDGAKNHDEDVGSLHTSLS